MMFFEPESRDRRVFPWDPFKGLVVPRPIARCGYDEYAVVEAVFSMKRPESGGNSLGGDRALLKEA